MDKSTHSAVGIIFMSIPLSVVASVVTFFLLSSAFPGGQLSTAAPEDADDAAVETQGYTGANSSESQLIEVVAQATPAVVSIVVTKDIPIIERFLEERSTDSFFDDFFGFSVPRYQERQNGTREQEVGGGSGFFVSADGLIITNRHVVDDDDASYTVVTSSGERYEAQVLARDPIIDIAVLQVEGDGFAYLDFADSRQIQPGQTAIAIGNALAEFENSVSVGVVSGLSRSIVAGGRFSQGEVLDGVIQTDTAINPGNSGGPLLNLNGEVIGVNVAVAQGVENIGFSIPANIVREIAFSVKENGEIVRPFLGIRYMMISESMVERNDLPLESGALISRGETREDLAVLPGSPADKAGLEENDIIVSIDGEELGLERPLATLLRSKRVGQEITLRVWREGEEIDILVMLEKAPQ